MMHGNRTSHKEVIFFLVLIQFSIKLRIPSFVHLFLFLVSQNVFHEI